jgi:Xaa-Pro aminopeptidase
MTNIGLTPGAFDAGAIGQVEHAFPRDEYLARIDKVRALMQRDGIDLLWVTSPDAVCWLHGFTASWYKANAPMRYPQCYGTAIHADSGRFIHFDNPSEHPVLAYTSVSQDNRFLPDREAEPNIRFIMGELASEGWLTGSVGMEFWSYVPNRAISTMFEGAFLAHGACPRDASALLREARRVKSPAEIETIEKAMEICDIGHQAIVDNLEPGMTELDLFGKVTAAMMTAGGEFPALIPIFNATPVVDGKHQHAGHSMAGRRKIEKGSMLTADLCGVYNRYHANVLRGYYVGGPPPPEVADQYRRAAGVFDVIRTDVKAGMTVREVNTRLRAYYEEVGIWSETEGWALGYELGLSFPPDWVGDFYFHLGDNKYLDRVFEENMVTNFESLFSTALIDTLVYGADGTRVLSQTPLELIAVG